MAIREAIADNRGTVIEDGDGAVGQSAGVVLPVEPGAFSHLEVALLATKPAR